MRQQTHQPIILERPQDTAENYLQGTIQILLLLGAILIASCTGRAPKEEALQSPQIQERRVFSVGLVSADNQFDGARLSDFKKLDESTYQALINPERTPINNSPWFSFRIWSEEAVNIILEIAYHEDHQHRYIPKYSHDGHTWASFEQSQYEVDTTAGKLRIDLNLTTQKLWVSSQENLNSKYITDWSDSLVKASLAKKKVIGQSVLGQPISLLTIREGSPKYSMIIVGRQHPPEVPGGTISMMSFVETILSDSEPAQSFREQFEILVFPLMNPDGVDNGNWRYNANGVDLNRDWELFSQPETQAARDWLIDPDNSSGRQYSFGIDFHTSYSGPYLLTLDTIPHQVKPVVTTKWIDLIEHETKDSLDIRPRAQSLPYCYNWMINELGIEAVTYEEGDEIERDVIKKRAQDYANALMTVLIEKSI